MPEKAPKEARIPERLLLQSPLLPLLAGQSHRNSGQRVCDRVGG